jgi:hypothetical protein
MSGEHNALEKSMEDIIVNLMTERVMSVGIQALSTGELQASPSTGRRSGRTAEKQRKHHDDMANAKQISSVLLDYIPPLFGVVSCDNISHDFEYILITAYIFEGIHVVGTQLGHIPALKKNDFNLRDRKNYAMLAPHRYLMKMTVKKPHIVSQPWIKELAQSMILNVMKIPHFGRHQEVNTCVKILLSCYHGGYLWLDKCITVDLTLIHLITGLSMQGPNPH